MSEDNCGNCKSCDALADKLAAANERIRELEKKVHHWTCEALGINNDLVAERAVSDRLLEALKMVMPYAEAEDYGGGDIASALAVARTAIAEVEAMRSKDK